MSESEGDGRLSDELVASLEPGLQDGLNHPTRREILRVLQAGEEASSVAGLLDELPPLKRGEIRYHLQVLQNCEAVVGEGMAASIGGGDARYRSALADDQGVEAVLRATERQDRTRRLGGEGEHSSGLLTMFRVPRPQRTISLSNLLGRRRGRGE